MKVFLIYFSATGNTELITSEIAVRFKGYASQIETVSVEGLGENERQFNFKLRTADLLGFGFPVYKLSYPEIMNRLTPFLENLKPEGKPFFVYSTYCRFVSDSLHRMARAVEAASGFTGPVYMQAFKCPSNGIASLTEADSKSYTEVMYFEPGIGRKLDIFVNGVISGLEKYLADGAALKHRGSRFALRRESLAGRIEQCRYPKLSIDVETCVVCGLCARRCPDGNLQLSREENKRIIIKDDTGCLHCLRCLHICPKNSITFGPLVQGPMRYTPKIRKALFAEAEQLPPGAAEPGSRLARLRWAAGALRSCFFRNRLK